MQTHVEEVGQFDPNGNYKPLTNKQVKEIAVGMIQGTHFTSLQVRRGDEQVMNMIFMPLMFMDDVTHKQMRANKIVHLYGTLDNAAPRSINGYPILYNMGFLNGDDAKRVYDKWGELSKIMSTDDEEENG